MSVISHEVELMPSWYFGASREWLTNLFDADAICAKLRTHELHRIIPSLFFNQGFAVNQDLQTGT